MQMDQDRVPDCASAEVPGEIDFLRESTPSVIESHDEIPSMQGSVNHPYRSLMNESGLPRCHRVAAPPPFTESYDAQTYTRAMLRQGNGTPLWDPIGYMPVRLLRIKNSLSIGDVGCFLTNGSFEYYFNILLPQTHPEQGKCPPDFEPLSPPLKPTDLVTNETHFSPLTTLVSPGVDVSCSSTDPLDITFTIRAREAGILLMPEGGAREDLTQEAANRVRDHILKHVQYWYTLINPGGIHAMILNPNASLCVITGHDKAPSWAVASAYPYNVTGKLRSIRYSEGGWTQCAGVSDRAYKTTPEYMGDHCAVFVRTMRFALCKKDWIEYLLENEPIDIVAFHYMPTVPALGLRARYQTLKERIFKSARKAVSDQCCEACKTYYVLVFQRADDDLQTVFSPLVVILQYILAQSASFSTAVIEDSVWHAVASESNGSFSSTARALVKLLESHEIFQGNGYVTLIPKSISTPDDHTSSMLGKLPFSLLDILIANLQRKRRRRSIASKLSKVFPGPRVPPVFLVPVRKVW